MELGYWWRGIIAAATTTTTTTTASTGRRWERGGGAGGEGAGTTIVIIDVIGVISFQVVIEIRKALDLDGKLTFTRLVILVAFFCVLLARNSGAAVPHFHFLVGEAVLALEEGGKEEGIDKEMRRDPVCR